LLDRAVSDFDNRFTTRVLRGTASIRRRWNADMIAAAIKTYFPKGLVFFLFVSLFGFEAFSMMILWYEKDKSD